MTRLLEFVVYMTLLTWISIMLGAALRNREWTLDGMKVGLSNRDHLPEATAARRAGGACRREHQGELHPVRRTRADRPTGWSGRAGDGGCRRLLLGASGLSARVSARHHVCAQRDLGRRHRRARHDAAGAALKSSLTEVDRSHALDRGRVNSHGCAVPEQGFSPCPKSAVSPSEWSRCCGSPAAAADRRAADRFPS